MFRIIEQIYFNLYSYSCYIIIGLILYVLSSAILYNRLKNHKEATFLIFLIVLSIILPFCNCLAIIFYLYDINDNQKVLLYIISTYIKLHAIVLVYAYFGMEMVVMYLLLIVLYYFIFLILSKFINKNNNVINIVNINETYNYNRIFNKIVRFIFYYLISVVLMSIFDLILPYQFSLYFINNTQNINIINAMYISISKYICIPNDISNVALLVASGMSIKLVFIFLLFGVLFNSYEIFLIIIYFKQKLALILSNIIVSLLSYLIVSNFIMNNYSFNYDLSKNDNIISLSNLWNINPNYMFRILSIVIIIALSAVFIYKNKFKKESVYEN